MTTPVDLTNCDREPIHIPGSIQPHGAMLVCDPSTFQILFASQNLQALTGAQADPTGLDLATVVGVEAAHDIRNAAAKSGGSEIAGVVLAACLPGSSAPMDIVVHRYKDRAFVEIEPSDPGNSGHAALDTTQVLIRRIGLESDVGAIVTTGAKLVRGMLGYDRVMIYQFLHNGAGKVIAEAKHARLGSFMGQHFPAADIPYQARRLYLANTIRMIGDVSYAPVPLQPALAPGQPPIDMSFAQLRSVSPIHCQYLQNMGVYASMSISIIADGELWGLISCHHDAAKITPLPLRIGAELFGQYFSLQISLAERRAQIGAANLARDRLDKIITHLSATDSLADNLRGHLEGLAELVESDGVALWMDGVWSALGQTPPVDAVPGLIDAIKTGAAGAVWHTQDLREVTGAPLYGQAFAGMLAVPLSSTPQDYLLFFRSEEAHAIEWAGEPVKTVVQTDQGERLTPRGSFATWREDVRGRSKPWTNAEHAVAEAIRTYLRDVLLRHSERTADERQRAEQRRRVLNDELNHRVKNIIALVKSIALQTGAHASSVADYSASLEGRLRALAFAHDQSLTGQSAGDLATLVEAEASLYRYGATPDRVVATGPKARLDDQAFSTVALVLHEMMTNAAKYGALSAPEGRLKIGWRFDSAGDCEIIWEESGGPAVKTPARSGFGTKLVQTTLTYDLKGQAQVNYEPSGVRARFVIPSAHAVLDDRDQAPVEEESTTQGSLANLNILVVEDQALIAMDIEETLRGLGVRDVRASPTASDAIDMLVNFMPDAAVLDFNLGAETSEAVANDLMARGIPFVFATGYGDSVMIPQRFAEVPIVRKPVSATTLVAKIDQARFPSAEDRSVS
ncbi:HWE histidine kinase domain-containing protein [Caulobacter hibisci]|uniref:histidine kinase n=1 Tax=Caulobacter hibisci TaxID=2035993 RepID=A0ABS0SX45_9CAUL|nr:HWE histidine kinase domain-containing protein [Caulobacter hibisci]MBI1684168.1 GAF domain-containing protein [Caulobacter hibisci]